MRKEARREQSIAPPTVSGVPHRTGRKSVARIGIAALFAVLVSTIVISPAAGQEPGTDEVVRIVARKLADGKIEFALQQRQPDGTWAHRLLPRLRLFPTGAAVDRWLNSSPVELPVGNVRIVARKLADGKIEFALQQHRPDATWGDRLLPRLRFFPTGAAVDRWLNSSPLALTAPEPPGRYTAVAAGARHTCGLRTDGTITCWGISEMALVPGVVQPGLLDPPAGQYRAITAGYWHSCGLRIDGTVSCWGAQAYGETIPPDGQFTAVVAGGFSSCGLRTDGTVTCWGAFDDGLLDPPADQLDAIAPGGVVDHAYACGLRTDGTITCWGPNAFGRATARSGQYSALATGSYHTCGLGTDGTVTCWGRNHYGQSDAPAGRFTAVSAGSDHTCGLRPDGTIRCWGRNFAGATEAPAGQFTAVTAGGYHTCGLRLDSTVTCWGQNDDGQTDVP